MTGPGINADGAGGVDMRPEAAAAMMSAIIAAAGTLKVNWAASLATIQRLESQLGKGPLGRPFAGDYNANVRQPVETADLLHEQAETTGSVGARIVAGYIDVDQRTGQYYQY